MSGSAALARRVRITRRAASRVLARTPLDGPVRQEVLPRVRDALGSSERAEGSQWDMIEVEVREALSGDGPVVVGPWLSELGFEVLYWIPFLNWLVERYGVPPERLVAISRGGVGAWYGHLAHRYLELFDAMSPAEFRRLSEARWASGGGQKQLEYGRFDRQAIEAVGIRTKRRPVGVLHPSLMYRVLARYWREATPVGQVLDRTRHLRFRVPSVPLVADRLPQGDYVAMKFYFRPSLPDDAQNRRAATELIRRMADRLPVVLLNTGLEVDDHQELAIDDEVASGRVVPILDGVSPAQNLAAQSVAIAGAKAFFGTYGGLSYLAPAYGTESFAFHSVPEHFVRPHLDLARRAASRTGGSLTLIDLHRPVALHLLEGWSAAE